MSICISSIKPEVKEILNKDYITNDELNMLATCSVELAVTDIDGSIKRIVKCNINEINNINTSNKTSS